MPLNKAVENESTQILKLFLDNGVDVNVVGNDGVTALIAAAETGNAKIVRLLLEAGALVNIQSKVGNTE